MGKAKGKAKARKRAKGTVAKKAGPKPVAAGSVLARGITHRKERGRIPAQQVTPHLRTVDRRKKV